MTADRLDERRKSRADFFAAAEILLVLRPADRPRPFMEGPDDRQAAMVCDLYIAVEANGRIVAFNGHVDLGTGIRTALAQIVAEELDVPLDHVTMILGDTALAPNQGATIASETIQVTAIPLRQAAASARAYLVQEASRLLDLEPDDIVVEAGIVRSRTDSRRRIGYGDLIRGRHVEIPLREDAVLKAPETYGIVGRSTQRVDIPAKATGAWTYVHDVRRPGMLHGRVVRPPYAGFDIGAHVGHSLVAVDEASVADIPGLVAIVVIRDFIGVVTEREEHAVEAARRLRVTWKEWAGVADLNAPEAAVRGNPATPRVLLDRGDVDRAMAGAAQPMTRTYVWPFHMHGSIGPSCSVADYRDGTLTVWSGTQNPYPLRADLARLLDLDEARITIERYEAAGCYGRNCADDVGADAALLSRAVGRPVRVQLSREQEHAWEPKGAAQVMDVAGGLDEAGGPAAYDFATRYPSNGAPTLALLLTGTIPATPAIFEMGDRTAIPPYAYGNARITVQDMPPIARASWLRGVSALPNTFAHESFIDELASAARIDPIEYRLRYLADRRGADLIRAVAEKAGWRPHVQPFTHGGDGDILHGRGFAYAVYVHGPFPGKAAAWSAWVADVAVNKVTGEVMVTKVTVGQDTGMMINPAGVQHQIHGNVIQSTSRVLMEEVAFNATAVTSLEWGSYPILAFPQVPAIDVVMMDRQDEPPLGAGESASVPSAAAITNALFDATGIRFRELPLTPERVRAAMNPLPPPAATTTKPKRRRFLGFVVGAAGLVVSGALGLATTALPLRGAFAPIARPDPSTYSQATIARGRLVAAVGACAVCHTGPNGLAYAGGKILETPFGRIVTTNITSDRDHGIGAWSYPAFERAMREGIHRDGRHLYPAHPYPSFARASEADLQALYAYLMATPPVAVSPPPTRLTFPFNLRPLMAGWNMLFLSAVAFRPDPARSATWNRGAYLVEGLGHCGACHTGRNALGAERRGTARLAGGFADGWEAPALTAASWAPVAWTEDAFYDYLRAGHATHHGGAAGPMGEVIEALTPLPDGDIRAMAVYLASLAASEGGNKSDPAAVVARSDAGQMATGRGARTFDGACRSCHGSDTVLTSLALNTNLHSAHPDNVIQAILSGVARQSGRLSTRSSDVADMPSFSGSLTDGQVAEVVAYLRARFAPEQPAWIDVAATVRRIRRSLH